MSNPQQPELARSRKTPGLDPDAAAGVAASSAPASTEPAGPVPEENQPGHRPDQEQDKPDLDAFAARLGVATDEGDEGDEGTPATGDRRSEGAQAPAAGPAGASDPAAAPAAGPVPAAAPATSSRPPRPLACQLVDLAVSSVRVPLAVLRAVRRRLG